MKISQKESVFQAIVELTGTDSFSEKVKLSSNEKNQVAEIVTTSIMDGLTEFSEAAQAKYSTAILIKNKYVKGMVDNWLTKDTRLNGGTPYKTKNPGIRHGSTNPEIKELQKLKTTLTNADHIAQVDAAIEAKKNALQAEKIKKIEINTDLIPDELKDLI